MTWREQIKNGYPWMPLALVAVMVIFMLATVYAMVFVVPSEREVIANGTPTVGHAVAWKDYGKNHTYSWMANITWTDADGHPHEQKELAISADAAAVIGDGRDVAIKYIGDRAVISKDVDYRLRDESNAPFVLGLWVIVALLGLYHWRRRLREWRSPKPVQW